MDDVLSDRTFYFAKFSMLPPILQGVLSSNGQVPAQAESAVLGLFDRSNDPMTFARDADCPAGHMLEPEPGFQVD